MSGGQTKLRVLDLFSGIGGFSLGLERTGGFETVAFCEIEDFPRRVLAKHWPDVPCYDDVRTLTGARLAADGIGVDVICGGFPCQDISTAGRQAGITENTRSGLWSEIIRLAGELRPKFICVENVANLLRGPSEWPGRWFGRILGDLAELGFDAEWENIPAAALGAPHRRERVWLVSYPSEKRSREVGTHSQSGKIWQVANDAGSVCQTLADADQTRLEGGSEAGNLEGFGPGIFEYARRCSDDYRRIWAVEPGMGRVAHGVPNRAHRIAALGNAIVPQIAELLGHAILQSERRAA